MPARKATSKSSKKAASKTSAKSREPLNLKEIKAGIRPLYAVPIEWAAARGDATEMRQLATIARKHVKDVQTALDKLERRLAKSSAK